jgi:NMD protein affecting ribosome stability and mRNA decay
MSKLPKKKVALKNKHQDSHAHKKISVKKTSKIKQSSKTNSKTIHKTNRSTKSIKPVHKFYSKKFCPNCGNPITDDNTLCKNCRITNFDFKDLKLFVCNHCQSYNYKNKWQKFQNLNNVMKMIVTNSVKHKVDYTNMDDELVEELLSYKAGVHRDFNVEVTIGKEKFELPAVIDVTLCPKCSKQGTKYFEGVLQVRNMNEEILDFIKKDLTKQRSKGVHINKEVDIDGTGMNMDYYCTNKKYMKVIGEKLRKEFGAIVKQNAQLFSIDWETSKNVYRLNILIQFTKYQKNDVIKFNKQLFKIISMDEKIHATNLETNNKTLLPHKEDYDILKPVEVILIKKYPEFEILDPNTYYQARLMNPSETLEINQTLRVIIDGGEAWIV